MKRPPNTCDVPGCTVAIRRTMLMCHAHWFQTPKPLCDALMAAWDEGRTRDWSAHVLEARRYHSNNNPAALAARITGEQP